MAPAREVAWDFLGSGDATTTLLLRNHQALAVSDGRISCMTQSTGEGTASIFAPFGSVHTEAFCQGDRWSQVGLR